MKFIKYSVLIILSIVIVDAGILDTKDLIQNNSSAFGRNPATIAFQNI